MTLLAIAAALLAIGVAALVLSRWRVKIALEGKLEASGAWAVGGGGALGPFAIAASASNDHAVWLVSVFGKRVRVARRATKRARFDVRLLRRVRIENVRARVRCGSSDPELTGRAAGVLAVLSATLAPFGDVDSEIDWMPERDHLGVSSSFEVSFVPLELARELLR